MNLSVSRVQPDEFENAVYAVTIGFNGTFDEKAIKHARTFLDQDRMFVLKDGSDVVGASANLSLELTCPAATPCP